MKFSLMVLRAPRHSMFGANTPNWITEPSPVYVRKHVRDEYDPVEEEVELLVRSPESREVTVSARDIAS